MSVAKRDTSVIRRNRIRDGFADVIDLYGVDEKEAQKLLDDVINNRREVVVTKILDDINDQPLRPCRGGCGRMLKASNMDICRVCNERKKQPKHDCLDCGCQISVESNRCKSCAMKFRIRLKKARAGK